MGRHTKLEAETLWLTIPPPFETAAVGRLRRPLGGFLRVRGIVVICQQVMFVDFFPSEIE
jgi:hypothetical protein